MDSIARMEISISSSMRLPDTADHDQVGQPIINFRLDKPNSVGAQRDRARESFLSESKVDRGLAQTSLTHYLWHAQDADVVTLGFIAVGIHRLHSFALEYSLLNAHAHPKKIGFLGQAVFYSTNRFPLLFSGITPMSAALTVKPNQNSIPILLASHQLMCGGFVKSEG